MIHLSDDKRWIQRINPASVIRTAATQSVHDPRKLIDLASYRARFDQRYTRRPQPPRSAA